MSKMFFYFAFNLCVVGEPIYNRLDTIPSCWVKRHNVDNMWCSMGTAGGVKAQRILIYITLKTL